MSAAFSAIFVLLPPLFLVCSSEPVGDKSALLDFVRRLHHGRQLNWSGNTSACSDWVGVTCSKDRRRVVGVRLPGVGLNGAVPPNTLGRLSALQMLSLRRNNLTGPFPGELTRIPTLAKLHLQSNNFAGHLPSNLSLFANLTVLDLSSNRFNGSLPTSLSNLTLLVSLNLSHNSFAGQVPDFNLPNLQQLDLADNQLTGMLPRSLQKYPRSSFSGNNNLSVITPPLSLPPFLPPFPSPATKPIAKKTKLGESAMIGILIGSCAMVFIMLSVLLIVFYSKKRGRFDGVAGKMGSESPEKVVGMRDDGNRIVFFEGCRYAFDLEDLLRSSAEVLGKGTFGTAYKAILEDGTPVAVKRLKEVSAGRREFEQQMEVVGKIRHENVVELRGYYYSKDEKLMIYDYYSRGSVYTLLHGNVFNLSFGCIFVLVGFCV